MAKTKVTPVSLLRRVMISITCSPLVVSRLAVGSSARIRVGLVASARAMATRCCCAAAQLVGAVMGAVGQIHGFQQFHDARASLRGF